MNFFKTLVETYSNIHDRVFIHAPSHAKFYNDKDELENRVLAHIKVEPFEQKFKKDWAYIGPNGKDGIRNRYNDFGKWLLDNPTTPIEAPLVSIDKEGNVGFTNGRHRYAYLRDKGITHIPMSISATDYKNAVAHNLV